MEKFLDIQVRGGTPIIHGNHALTPFSQSVTVRIPGFPGGLIWNRPVSVLARSTDGSEQIIPIPDVTRQVQWALLGASLLFGMLAFWVGRRRK